MFCTNNEELILHNNVVNVTLHQQDEGGGQA